VEDRVMQEYRQALAAYNQAVHNFENANPEYVDAATYALIAAEERLAVAVRALRLRYAAYKSIN